MWKSGIANKKGGRYGVTWGPSTISFYVPHLTFYHIIPGLVLPFSVISMRSKAYLYTEKQSSYLRMLFVKLTASVNLGVICNCNAIFPFILHKIIFYLFIYCAELVTGKTSKDVVVGSELFQLNPGIEKYKLTLRVTTPSGSKGEKSITACEWDRQNRG